MVGMSRLIEAAPCVFFLPGANTTWSRRDPGFFLVGRRGGRGLLFSNKKTPVVAPGLKFADGDGSQPPGMVSQSQNYEEKNDPGRMGIGGGTRPGPAFR
jgi:hypothetical protein